MLEELDKNDINYLTILVRHDVRADQKTLDKVPFKPAWEEERRVVFRRHLEGVLRYKQSVLALLEQMA